MRVFSYSGVSALLLLTACGTAAPSDVPCVPDCPFGYTCDRSRGRCEEITDECTEYHTCDCAGDGFVCEGATLSRCTAVPLSGLGGVCGVECETTPLTDCPDGCEDGPERPHCAGDDPHCFDEVPSFQRLEFGLTWLDSETSLGCHALTAAEPELTVELSGEVVDWWMVLDVVICGVVVQTDGGAEAEVIDNCLVRGELGTRVQLRLRWRLEPGNGCVSELVAHYEDQPPLFAAFGSYRPPPDVPYEVGLVDLQCSALPPGPCGTPKTYALDFTVAGLPTERIYQHDPSPSPPVTDGTHIYQLRNYASCYTGECEDASRVGVVILPNP